jgi:hypothetical protein
MSSSRVDQIAAAVLYEGYILYPYRPSVKNRQRWTFGGLYPKAYSEAQANGDAWTMQTECLVVGNERTRITAKVRFLHLMDRTVGELTRPIRIWPQDREPEFRTVESLRIGDKIWQRWQEAVEQEVILDESDLISLAEKPRRQTFTFPLRRLLEPLRGSSGAVVGVVVRKQQIVEGAIELTAASIGDGLIKLTVRIFNHTSLGDAARKSHDEALLHSLVSTHSIFGVRDGEFISLTDPPDRWRKAPAMCRNIGMWPVLVGEEGQKDTMLAAPIILYDYPQIAPESPGEFFDRRFPQSLIA